MPILMTALVLGAISMLIVIFSGLTSGLVRLGVLSLSVASYNRGEKEI